MIAHFLIDGDTIQSRDNKKKSPRDREIVRLTAIKNHQNVEEAQKEYTRKMQREYRGRNLSESRERAKLRDARITKLRE